MLKVLVSLIQLFLVSSFSENLLTNLDKCETSVPTTRQATVTLALDKIR